MAESRAERALEAPCMGVPPVMVTLVFEFLPGAGDDVRELLLEVGRDFGFMSEMRAPAAEGGARGAVLVEEEAPGAWTALGCAEREKIFELAALDFLLGR